MMKLQCNQEKRLDNDFLMVLSTVMVDSDMFPQVSMQINFQDEVRIAQITDLFAFYLF